MSNRSGLTIWSWFLGALISLLFFYFILKIFPPCPSDVYVPVQSPPVFQHVPDPSRSRSLPVLPGKESQIVSTAGGDYSGYIEHDGKRYDVYEPFIKSQTFRYYSQGRNTKILTVEINGVPFEMLFDTGASYVSLNSDAVRKLGVKSFVREIMVNTTSGRTASYQFYASIKLGSFEVNDVECGYIPASSQNLLGGSFLKHFNYSIDESVGTITLSLK